MSYLFPVVSLKPTLNIINNVSSSTDILILHGQNDSASPVQASFLLQQTLTDKRHPDHTLITYPNLCHFFYPSSEWQTSYGPIPEYVLADLYAWLESHSGFTSTPATSMPSSTYSSSSNSTTTK
jgi:dienelactone hydrolase